MELKLNLAILAALFVVWSGLRSTSNVTVIATSMPSAELRMLEDQVAQNPADRRAALELATVHLNDRRFALAAVALRGVSIEGDADVAHALAVAYEGSGRVTDAFLTADSALAICARAIGTRERRIGAPAVRSCSEPRYLSLEAHRNALEHMVSWGVTDPERDPRTLTAYRRALRTAHVALY